MASVSHCKRMAILLALLLVAQSGKLAPVNDANRDKSFADYTKKLKSAIARRDAGALRKLVHDDVITGGFTKKDEKGWAAFAERWQVDNQQSHVWDVLADFLDLGFFRASPQTFVSPYVVWKFPRDLDPNTHVVVVLDALPLMAEPRRDSAVTATLAFDIVRLIADADATEAFGWVEVETLQGKRGFIQKVNVRSPMMERGQFQLSGGRWGILALDRGPRD